MGCHSTKCKMEEAMNKEFIQNIMKTNEKNVDNIETALENSRKQNEAAIRQADTIGQMAKTQNDLQNEYIRERKRNDEMTKEVGKYMEKLIENMAERIAEQKQKIEKLGSEKAEIQARAAGYEEQLTGLKSIYDESESDMKELKKAMKEMKEKNKKSNDKLIEELRRSDVAMVDQAVTLIALR